MWQCSFVSYTYWVSCSNTGEIKSCAWRNAGDLYTPKCCIDVFLKGELKFCYIAKKKLNLLDSKYL